MVKTGDRIDKEEKYQELYDIYKSQNQKTYDFEFENARYYIEDYWFAKKTNQDFDNDFSDKHRVDELMRDLEEDYLYEGILGTNQVSRVLSAPFNKFLMDSIQ